MLSAFCFLRPALAAPTNLTSTLQQALFEEEANHNLNAAIQSYQALVSQFDQDRKLAATAVFRLGECYRKQGNTNEATAQYERIIRDFSDQATLLALSRQNLAAFSGNPNASGTARSAATAARDAELMGLEGQIAELKRLPREKQRIAVQQSAPNSVLNSLMQQLVLAEQRLGDVQHDFGPEHAEVIKAKGLIETISKQIDAQVEGALTALEARRDALAKAALQDPNSMHASTTAREEQKRLLEEEIKLVEKQLASQQKQVDGVQVKRVGRGWGFITRGMPRSER